MPYYFQVLLDADDPYERSLAQALSSLKRGSKHTMLVQMFAACVGGDTLDPDLLAERMRRFMHRLSGGGLEDGHERHRDGSAPLGRRPAVSTPLQEPPVSEPLQRPAEDEDALRKKKEQHRRGDGRTPPKRDTLAIGGTGDA